MPEHERVGGLDAARRALLSWRRMQDPDKHDNLGLLRGKTGAEREMIIKHRKERLEKQIRGYERQVREKEGQK